MEAFFEQVASDRYIAGPLTGGPWDPRMQHGGPISALLARILSDVDPVPGQSLARATFELLRPVPIGRMNIAARVARGGKKVSLAEAVVRDDQGAELILARGWRLQPTPFEIESTTRRDVIDVEPESLQRTQHSFSDQPSGFLQGIDVRFARSGFDQIGPGAAWFRLLAPLVAGTEMRASDPVFCAADCANGVSSSVDFSRYVYINCELSVHVLREPVGEWVGLQAETSLAPGGTSFSSGTLCDRTGAVGSSRQALYVGAR
jgi:hypothetical protein